MKRTNLYQSRRRARNEGPLLINFMLGEDLYAIDMKWISKVDLNIRITPVPFVPSFIVGVTSVGDEVISVIDLRKFMEVRGAKVEAKSQIVMKVNDQHVAFLSDTVPGFITLDRPIQTIADEEVSVLIGISEHRGRIVNLIDAEQLYWLLTRNLERIQNRILRKVTDRVTEVLGNVQVQVEQSEPYCQQCDNLGFLVVELPKLFTTMLQVLNDIQTRLKGEPLNFTTASLRDAVEACLNAHDPFTSLTEVVQPQLGDNAFQILLHHLEEHHVTACPGCGQG